MTQARAAIIVALTLGAGGASAGALIVDVTDAHGAGAPSIVIIAEPSQPIRTVRPAHHAIMDQRDLQFVPEVLVIQTGTLVDFPNSDQVRHQVYSFSPAKTFQLSLYAGRAHPPVEFDRGGIVTLGCNIHDSMIGYIYVSDSPYFGETDQDGRLELRDLPAGSYTVRAWHPRADEPAEALTRQLTLTATDTRSLMFHLTRPLKPSMQMPHGGHRKWGDY